MTDRQCFYIDMESFVEGKGYIPSLVTEGSPGHALLAGDPEKFQQPWYWGHTFAEAQETADRANEKMGLTPDDVTAIVMSSMRAGKVS